MKVHHGTVLWPLREARGSECRAELDEDVPGGGQFYCISCSRYFVDAKALALHQKSKAHKRRIAELAKLRDNGMKPHSAADAEWAAGMAKPDNGPRLRAHDAAVPMLA